MYIEPVTLIFLILLVFCLGGYAVSLLEDKN